MTRFNTFFPVLLKLTRHSKPGNCTRHQNRGYREAENGRGKGRGLGGTQRLVESRIVGERPVRIVEAAAGKLVDRVVYPRRRKLEPVLKFQNS